MLVGCLGFIAALGLFIGFAAFTQPYGTGPITMIISLLILIVIIRYINRRRINKNYYNDNNDGIYSHCYSFFTASGLIGRQVTYEIIIDTNKRTVFLRSDKRAKTFSFSDIKSWETSLIQDAQLNVHHLQNFYKGGLFITTRDFDNPIWQIKFKPQKGNSLEQQYRAWMNVFDRVFNGR